MIINTDYLQDYANGLVKDIPYGVYEGAASFLCFGVVVVFVWKGIKKGIRYAIVLALIDYLFLLYCGTVLFRKTKEIREYDYHPFWSYRAMETSLDFMMAEIIMNVVLFVPVGFLLGIVSDKIKWWIALFIGSAISFGIEFLQLVLVKGFSEVDDVIHNTIGFVWGYIIAITIKDVGCFINTKIYGK